MKKWLNKNIIALGLVSLFSDMGHEMVAAILPTFLLSIGGTPAILGFIEGVADAAVSFMKIGAGWASDFMGKRKPFAVVGYAIATVGVASYYFAYSWIFVFYSRVLTRLGKGVRDPARDALLVESTEPAYYGRAFGLQRSMDTLGAILGPLLAFILLGYFAERTIFLWGAIPLIISVFIMVCCVQEQPIHKTTHTLLVSLQRLPTSFLHYLGAVGTFGLGKFSASLLILRAAQLLTPSQGALTATLLSILLYAVYNVVYAATSLPAGYIADFWNKRYLLSIGYVINACAAVGFMYAPESILYCVCMFALAGLSIGITDALERSIAADLLPADARATGYGVFAAVTGIGAFVSSTLVGVLWTYVSPALGFGYAALFSLAGAILVMITASHAKKLNK